MDKGFKTALSIDMFLVSFLVAALSVKSFVHLIVEMASDRTLPEWFAADCFGSQSSDKKGGESRVGIQHRLWIPIFLLLGLGSAVVFVAELRFESLVALYELSFLVVALLIGYANLMMKWKRTKLNRPAVARLPFVFGLLFVTVLAIFGVLDNQSDISVFLLLLVGFVACVEIMFQRVRILHGIVELVGAGGSSKKQHRFVWISFIIVCVCVCVCVCLN